MTRQQGLRRFLQPPPGAGPAAAPGASPPGQLPGQSSPPGRRPARPACRARQHRRSRFRPARGRARGVLRAVRDAGPAGPQPRGGPGTLHPRLRLPGLLPAVHRPGGRPRPVPRGPRAVPVRSRPPADQRRMGRARRARRARLLPGQLPAGEGLPASTRARPAPPSARWTWRPGHGSAGPTRCCRRAEADVEAILVNRTDDGVECFLVPIDACYELAGRMRLLLAGLRRRGGGAPEHRRVPRLRPGTAPASSAREP